MHLLELKIALLVFAGVATQWLAWRFRIPAIALLLILGLVAGPFTGILVPAEDFGEIFRPAVTLAVAVILFEGGLTLKFSQIRETGKAVRRIVLIGAPLMWFGSTLAAHYLGGLSWTTAAILGAILIVTGPTVIMPLLRQAKLQPRVASLLRWEAIVNDPVGALMAVITFEIYLVFNATNEAGSLFTHFVLMLLVAVPGAWLLARAIVWLFVRGHMPEYLKAPFLLATVIAAAAFTNQIMEEAGLLTVTVMGIVLANSRIASLTEMHRFKETISVILVSAVFVVLTASLDIDVLLGLGWPVFWFVVAILFIIRPIAVFVATVNTNLSWQERLFTAWIAPRGIVAVSVASVFGSALIAQDVDDGGRIIAFTFAVVGSTILLHGFSLPLLARVLGLKSRAEPGILLMGASAFTIALAEKLHTNDIPVLLADKSWSRLRPAKQFGAETYYGDILSEHAHTHLNLSDWNYLIAASDNEDYNALVCTEMAPEIGRSNVFQIRDREPSEGSKNRHFTIGGRSLFSETIDYQTCNDLIQKGWQFSLVGLTDEFGADELETRRASDSMVLFWKKRSGEITFANLPGAGKPKSGDKVLIFRPPE